MFDFIRKHTKITMGLLFLLIVPSFVLLGLNDYGSREGNTTVAQVDGRDITQAEWDNAHRQEVDRLRAQMPGLDLKLLDSPEAKYATLERLVRERVDYEESGWYDGQVWEKPLAWRQRDLLVARHQVQPVMDRLRRALLLTLALMSSGMLVLVAGLWQAL